MWPVLADMRRRADPRIGRSYRRRVRSSRVSGIALVLVLVLFVLVWRSTSKGDITRVGAGLSLIAIVGEALIGAMIVLSEWVADDDSVARAVAVPMHLVNTLLLLAALALTIFWLGGGRRLDFKARPDVTKWVVVGG